MPDEIHVHIDCPEYEAAEYAFQVLLAAADAPVVFHKTNPDDLSPDALLITYSRRRIEPAHSRHLAIRPSRKLWDQYGTEESVPSSPLVRVPLAELGVEPNVRLQDPLVVPYTSEADPPAAEVRRGTAQDSVVSIVTGVDLVASTFFWISRYEESLIRERDEFGRVPQELLRELQEKLTDRPLVDEYAELLMTWLEMLGPGMEFKRRPFRALLTHDVDTGIGVKGLLKNAENGLRTLYREAVQGRRPRTGMAGLGHWVSRALGLRDETLLFRDIVALDAEFGFPSFFFLMADGTHPSDATYPIAGDAARRVIQTIRKAGGDIGLHVGINAHRAPEQLRGEWEGLRRADPQAWPASRSHFLTFLTPDTWRQLLELGMRVDSTLGFSHWMGFRCGTCRGFRPFDVERREILPIWELPMILMDVNLFHEPGEDDAARISAVSKIVARVRAHQGILVVNWHNVSYIGHYLRVYRALLRELRGAQPVRLDDLPARDGPLVW